MNHEASVCLAQTEHGRVNICACGCIQLTFGRVTLHFESESTFVEMSEQVLREEEARQGDEEFDLQYEWFSMSLSPYGSAQFSRLVRDAVANLAWSRGDMTFTDEDFRSLQAQFPPLL